MKSKYELTISMNYVPSWSYVEALRELYQNAIDNEISNPENKMLLRREGDKVIICNKTSKLDASSLLIGNSTKSDDARTIGTHGEGYKLAIVVLLREGKGITIYNYGKREIWTTKMVKSRRYGGETIPVVYVEKEAIWKSVPDNDLTIEVTGISDEEFEEIKKKNLHLREEKLETFDVPGTGKVITDECERGNIYVKGLFVCRNEHLAFGYDFEPQVIKLDRDRRLIDSFNLSWETSRLWVELINLGGENREEYIKIACGLVSNNNLDTQYMKSNWGLYGFESSLIADRLFDSFVEENGEEAIPVEDNVSFEAAKSAGYQPIIVSGTLMGYYRNSDKVTKLYERIKETRLHGKISERLSYILENIKDSIQEDWAESIRSIITDVEGLEMELENR